MMREYTVKHMVGPVVATVALIAAVLAFLAVRYQTSGTAVYWTGFDSEQRHEVRREVSESEFRLVVTSTWTASACCFILAGLGLVLYRRLAADE
jgi:hypothetical protein